MTARSNYWAIIEISYIIYHSLIQLPWVVILSWPPPSTEQNIYVQFVCHSKTSHFCNSISKLFQETMSFRTYHAVTFVTFLKTIFFSTSSYRRNALGWVLHFNFHFLRLLEFKKSYEVGFPLSSVGFFLRFTSLAEKPSYIGIGDSFIRAKTKDCPALNPCPDCLQGTNVVGILITALRISHLVDSPSSPSQTRGFCFNFHHQPQVYQNWRRTYTENSLIDVIRFFAVGKDTWQSSDYYLEN